jgi:hypothetical protein
MNLQQFYAQTLSNGGASYSILSGELNPTQGYFVSLPNNEFKASLAGFNPNMVQDFIYKNSEALNKENTFVGSWVDNGNVYLDVTVQVMDKRTALELGYRNGQRAIYDANLGQVINLPSPQRAGTFTQQRSYITSVIDRLCN